MPQHLGQLVEIEQQLKVMQLLVEKSINNNNNNNLILMYINST